MPSRICAILLLQLSMAVAIGLVFRVATCLPTDRTPQDSSRPSDKQTFQIGPRMSVAILSIEGEPAAAPLVQLADDYLMGALLERRRFQLIEREKMKQILKEQKLAREKLTAPEQSIRLGRLMAADVLLAATIRMTPSSMEATCRVIVTESSETLEVRAGVSGTDRGSLKELTKNLAARVAQLFPMAGGSVTDYGSQLIRTDIGSATGVRTGMGAIVYRPGKNLTHPVTGRVIGQETVRLGEGYFADIRQDRSSIKLTRTEPGLKIRPGDRVITK